MKSKKTFGGKVHYKLSEDAKDDLKRIYRRGFEVFGAHRADAYYNELWERFSLIAEQPRLYPVADEIDKNLRKSVCGVDTIYYELTGDGVLIVRILGRQDRQSHL